MTPIPNNAPTPCTDDEVRVYLRSLQSGEEVIETGQSCMHLIRGTTYHSTNHIDDNGKPLLCVMWNLSEGGTMGTSVTWGTRRVKDWEATTNTE